MADWNTHLYCATKVNEALAFSGKDLDLFLYGNLFPDINMGWIITPETKLEQVVTHFDTVGQGYFWEPKRFYEKYMTEIKGKSPLHLGYMFHLWLDVSIMTDFVSRVSMSQMVSNKDETKKLKWKDMRIFINDYKFTLSDEYMDDILDASKSIEEVSVTKSDLIKVHDFINDYSSEYTDEEYSVYTSELLADFYDKTCRDFIKWCNETI